MKIFRNFLLVFQWELLILFHLKVASMDWCSSWCGSEVLMSILPPCDVNSVSIPPIREVGIGTDIWKQWQKN